MFSNIVYKFTFNNMKDKNSPYMYIGSKSNCYIKDNKIYDKNHKQYLTSSTNRLVQELIKEGDYLLEILYKNDDYKSVLEKENELQLKYDVVHDDRYFNKSLATINIYTDPNYITIRIDGKYKRVHKSYFESNNCVGTTKNMKWYYDVNNKHYVLDENDDIISTMNLKKGRNNLDLSGFKNPFYNKKHDEKTIKQIIESRNEFYKNNPDKYNDIKKKMSENMKKVSQLPKSEKFINQLKERGKNTLYIINIDSKEKLRINKSEYDNYKNNGWELYSTYQHKNKKYELIKCTYCDKICKNNNSSFYKWHFENCKHKPSNKDNWLPWLNVKDDEYKYYMYSKYDIIYKLYIDNKDKLSGKKLLPFIKESVIDRELNDSEYLFFKRMIEKIKKDKFSPLESENWIKEFRR